MTTKGEKPDPLIGTKLGDYEIQSIIGRGGMARVYVGYDAKLERYAAVKVMDADHEEDDELTQRFIREARAAANLDHPNIVTVYQYGDEHGGGLDLYYIAMKLIEGKTLLSILKALRKQKKYLPAEEVVNVITQIASALDYAHSKNVIHRDVKPSNIMITPDNKAILTDFGLTMKIGSESTLGTAFGTPRYIAPEQAIASHKAVPQTDIYSLGVVLYEMVAGQAPFDSDSPMTLALSHVTNPVPPPRSLRAELTHPVEMVILKALEKRPENRWKTASEMAQALKAAFDGIDPNITLSDEAIDLNSSLPAVASVDPIPTPPKSGRIVVPQDHTIHVSQVPSTPVKPARVFRAVWIVPILLAVALLSAAAFAVTSMQEPTPTPASSAIASIFSSPTPIPSRVRLIYSKNSFVVYNATDQAISLEGITFTRADQATRPFDPLRFGQNTYKNVLPGQCLQIWLNHQINQTKPVTPAACLQVTNPLTLSADDQNAIFWQPRGDKDALSSFQVMHYTTLLAECSLRVDTCELSLGS